MRSALIVAILILVCAFAGAGEIRLPELREGVINGKAHILFWPSLHPPPREGEPLRLLPAANCRVHLIPASDPDRELVEPCGRWLLLPNGKYRFLIEKDDLVSPWPGLFFYDSDNVDGKGMASVAGLVPGGRIALAADVAVPETAGMRLLHIPARDGAARPTKAFDRRVARQHARAGVLMPAGRVITALFDRSNDAIVVSRPLDVVVGQTLRAAPRPPARGSDVVLVLDRPRLRHSWEMDEVALTLGTRKPDVFVSASDRVFAVWYKMDGAVQPLAMTSKTLHFESRDVKLRPGRVVTIREKLVLLPSAKISLLAPPGVLEDETLTLEVRRLGQNAAIERAGMKANGEHVFEALPAEQLEAVLQVGKWDIPQPLDLRRGEDALLVFDLDPLTIRGTVYLGDARAPGAEIAFEADRGKDVVRADREGRYELNLWEPRGDYIAAVTIPGRAAAPFIEAFLLIDRDRTLDFHVPRTTFTVKVTDSKSGLPVSNARVMALNMWGEDSRVAQTVTTDGDGRAELQPLRTGELSLVIRADGYFDLRPPVRAVASAEAVEQIDVALDPVGEVIRVLLRHADGRPAAEAEAMLVRRTEGAETPLWQGKTDERGFLDVPRDFAGNVMLLRHRDAASSARQITRDDHERTWTLAPPAGELTLHLEPRPRGRRGARIALWIDAFRVSGTALTFLSWWHEATDSRGVWSGRNLPPVPVHVLAWETIEEGQVASGAYDGRPVVVPYPWPATVRVRAID